MPDVLKQNGSVFVINLWPSSKWNHVIGVKNKLDVWNKVLST